jgi:hypothetical protein
MSNVNNTILGTLQNIMLILWPPPPRSFLQRTKAERSIGHRRRKQLRTTWCYPRLLQTGKNRFEQCSTFDETRQFLVEHLERVIYVHSKVTIPGLVSFKRCTHQAPISASFRIEGELE